MQLTITLPDIFPGQVTRVMTKVREFFAQEGIPVEINPIAPKGDSWDNLNVEDIAIYTGISDFTENHDHYFYGTPKR